MEMARTRVQQSGPGVQLRARIAYPSGWITLANTGKPDSAVSSTNVPSPADMNAFWYSAERVPAQHMWLKVSGHMESECNGNYGLYTNSAFSASRKWRKSQYPVWRK